MRRTGKFVLSIYILAIVKLYFAHEKGFVAIGENMYGEKLSPHAYIQHALLWN